MNAEPTSRSRTQGGYCPRCGAEVAAGDRFCRACGSPLDASSPDRLLSGPAGLKAIGLAVIALAIVVAFLYYSRGQPQPEPALPISIGQVGAGGASAEPMSPRQAADGLFNQAMMAYETGDSGSAASLVPMALAAYRDLVSLDLDARYHIALLSLVGDRTDGAIAQVDTMLAEVPEHLLALSVAARTYDRLGDSARAAEFYRRFLDAYTPEVAVSRTEYIDHGNMLPGMQETARQYLESH